MIRFCCFNLTSLPVPRQGKNIMGFIFFLFYYTNIVEEIHMKLKYRNSHFGFGE